MNSKLALLSMTNWTYNSKYTVELFTDKEQEVGWKPSPSGEGKGPIARSSTERLASGGVDRLAGSTTGK